MLNRLLKTLGIELGTVEDGYKKHTVLLDKLEYIKRHKMYKSVYEKDVSLSPIIYVEKDITKLIEILKYFYTEEFGNKIIIDSIVVSNLPRGTVARYFTDNGSIVVDEKEVLKDLVHYGIELVLWYNIAIDNHGNARGVGVARMLRPYIIHLEDIIDSIYV